MTFQLKKNMYHISHSIIHHFCLLCCGSPLLCELKKILKQGWHSLNLMKLNDLIHFSSQTNIRPSEGTWTTSYSHCWAMSPTLGPLHNWCLLKWRGSWRYPPRLWSRQWLVRRQRRCTASWSTRSQPTATFASGRICLAKTDAFFDVGCCHINTGNG